LLCWAAFHGELGAFEPPPWRWQDVAGESLALLSGQQVVWQFNYADRQNKPCFHPLATVGGPMLTLDQPRDHVWHHGLWLSWKSLNGVNYWEPVPGTGKPEGHTEWSDVRVQRGDDFSARIAMRLAYRPSTGEVVLREDRTVRVSPPDQDGGYPMDWSSKFTAEADRVKFDRTPLPGEPGGVAWGGYAGLSLRMTPLTGLAATTPDGPVPFAGGRARLRVSGTRLQGHPRWPPSRHRCPGRPDEPQLSLAVVPDRLARDDVLQSCGSLLWPPRNAARRELHPAVPRLHPPRRLVGRAARTGIRADGGRDRPPLTSAEDAEQAQRGDA